MRGGMTYSVSHPQRFSIRRNLSPSVYLFSSHPPCPLFSCPMEIFPRFTAPRATHEASARPSDSDSRRSSIRLCPALSNRKDLIYTEGSKYYHFLSPRISIPRLLEGRRRVWMHRLRLRLCSSGGTWMGVTWKRRGRGKTILRIARNLMRRF